MAEMTTYKRADGEMIGDEYGWVADLDYFDFDDYPVELVEEVWERRTVRTFWHMPSVLYDCHHEDCDEDAVAWQQDAVGDWRQVCKEHRAEQEVST